MQLRQSLHSSAQISRLATSGLPYTVQSNFSVEMDGRPAEMQRVNPGWQIMYGRYSCAYAVCGAPSYCNDNNNNTGYRQGPRAEVLESTRPPYSASSSPLDHSKETWW